MERAELEAVRTIVSHDSCADGIASALLLHDALPAAEIIFADYGTAIDLPVRPHMLFCDFSPPPARVDEFVAAGAIVLDHHRSARPIVDKFAARGVFGDEKLDPGVSGAVLAYREVWRVLGGGADPVHAKWFAEAAGARDTWQTGSPLWRDGCVQHAVLLAFPQPFWMSLSFSRICAEWAERYAWVGEQLIAQRMDRVEHVLGQAHRFTTRSGVRVVAIPGHSLASDLSERVTGEADLVVAFGFVVEQGRQMLRISLRSPNRFDCAAFAQQHGGGGHTNAAGFGIAMAPDDPQPYTLIERLFDR